MAGYSQVIGTLLKTLLTGLVRAYQLFISPVLGSHCRFHPSCSHYMIEAINTHGLVKGTWLGIKRLGRCHPWSEGGIDPVPPCDQCQDPTHNQPN